MSKEQAETWAGFDVNEFQCQVIAEFRANNGKMSGMFEGWTLAVLTTVGAKSGLRRENILGYLEFAGKGIVVASSNGADKHPAWYHNIRKNPIVTVETGSDTYQAIAAIPPAQERDKLFDRVIAEAPGPGRSMPRPGNPGSGRPRQQALSCPQAGVAQPRRGGGIRRSRSRPGTGPGPVALESPAAPSSETSIPRYRPATTPNPTGRAPPPVRRCSSSIDP